MGMKKSMMGILGLALMGGMDMGFADGRSSRRTRTISRPAYETQRLVGQKVEYLGKVDIEQRIQKLTDICFDWNENSITKKKVFTIQGFKMQGNTLNSTRKRLRRFLVMAGFDPNTTMDAIESRFEELEKREIEKQGQLKALKDEESKS